MTESPDHIAGSATGIQIECSVVDGNTILLEGSKSSLEFLAA